MKNAKLACAIEEQRSEGLAKRSLAFSNALCSRHKAYYI